MPGMLQILYAKLQTIIYAAIQFSMHFQFELILIVALPGHYHDFGHHSGTRLGFDSL